MLNLQFVRKILSLFSGCLSLVVGILHLSELHSHIEELVLKITEFI